MCCCFFINLLILLPSSLTWQFCTDVYYCQNYQNCNRLNSWEMRMHRCVCRILILRPLSSKGGLTILSSLTHTSICLLESVLKLKYCISEEAEPTGWHFTFMSNEFYQWAFRRVITPSTYFWLKNLQSLQRNLFLLLFLVPNGVR